MTLQDLLAIHIEKALESMYGIHVESFEFQATRKDFEGDITLVTFPMLRQVKTNPVQLGESIGKFLVEHVDEVQDFNVVKGFLNIVISSNYYINFFNEIKNLSTYGFVKEQDDFSVMVEYSSPNTNKPLHLGHIRNNLLGYSVAEIIKASGKKVYKTQIINEIHRYL